MVLECVFSLAALSCARVGPEDVRPSSSPITVPSACREVEVVARKEISMNGSSGGRSLSKLVYQNDQRPDSLTFVSPDLPSGTDVIFTDLPRAAPGPYTPSMPRLDSLSFGISYDCSTCGPEGYVDVYIKLYDDVTTWDLSGSTEIGWFMLSSIPAPTTGAVVYSLTGLADYIWLPMDDTSLGVQIALCRPDMGLVIDPKARLVFNGDGPAAGPGKPSIGFSEDLFISEKGPNFLHGLGGAPYVANALMSVGVEYCDADFDASGFIDFEDFIAFVNAFESGC